MIKEENSYFDSYFENYMNSADFGGPYCQIATMRIDPVSGDLPMNAKPTLSITESGYDLMNIDTGMSIVQHEITENQINLLWKFMQGIGRNESFHYKMNKGAFIRQIFRGMHENDHVIEICLEKDGDVYETTYDCLMTFMKVVAKWYCDDD